jgi:hypothetical protein
MSTSEMLRRPIAFAPIAMSLAALAIVVTYVVIFGAARESDEGATAHVWQLLMTAQLPLIAFFLFRYLRQAPRSALSILALQLVAALAAVAPVYLLHL